MLCVAVNALGIINRCPDLKQLTYLSRSSAKTLTCQSFKENLTRYLWRSVKKQSSMSKAQSLLRTLVWDLMPLEECPVHTSSGSSSPLGHQVDWIFEVL